MDRIDERRCVVIVHSAGDGLGVLAESLVRQNLVCHFWYVPAGSDPPLKPSEVDLVISLGGAQHPLDKTHHDWQETEIKFILSAMDAGKAVLTICLGAQLLAKGLGSRIDILAEPEIGLLPLGEVARHSVLSPLGEHTVAVYQWHSYGFTCPPHAEPVALSANSSDFCQAFQFGPQVLAVQFHLELNRSLMYSWLSEEHGSTALKARVCAEIARYSQETEKVCADVFGDWLSSL